ncbi:MAG: EAL domain-containing protein [Alphaproteobacteria bacterium]|nr:EAL domain-containing protein [Alphaproteobacteria bacterium]
MKRLLIIALAIAASLWTTAVADEAAREPVPRSGLGGVILEPGPAAVDITAAVARYVPAPDDGPVFATYLVDLVNRLPQTQVRILVLDPGVFGGQGAPHGLDAPALVAALTSSAGATADVIDSAARIKVRVVIPAGETITAAFRFAAPLNQLTVEMWDERSLARYETAALVMQGLLMGLVIALGAWLAGIAILRRDRLSGWLSGLFGAAFLAMLAGFGYAGPFAAHGILTSAGLALCLFAGASAFALAFVVHALAPDGRWRRLAPVADYGPWLVAACGLLALLNAPYAAAMAKTAAVAGLGLCAALTFARAWEGDGPARRLTLSAVLILLAFAPLAMQETVAASGRFSLLAASGLLATALLLAAFATSTGSPALRQRVDRLLAFAPPPAALPPFPAPPPQPAAPAEDGRFGLALAAAHQGLWDWDLKRDRLFLSPSVEAMLGARPGQLQNGDRNWTRHIHEDDIATFLGALEDYRRLGDVSFVLDFRGRGIDGIHRWIQLRASFMSDGEKAARCIGLVSDVSAQKESEAMLLASARQDAVTGLANRAYFLDVLGQRLTFAAAERRHALLAFDIARFRNINESIGHAAGDAVLAALADRIRAAAPSSVLAARLGGDIFGLLWPVQGADGAAEEAKAVLDAAAVPLDIAGRRIAPLVRGGLLLLDGAPRDAAGALSDAEIALAEARRSEKETLVYFAPAMRDQKADRAVLERDLAAALEHGEILLHYQPIVRVADRHPAGFEALLRWQHPTRGLMTADLFAAIAEDSGFIEPLGRFALETAVKDSARWRRMAPQQPPLFVNVNVSARQLASPAFLELCERMGAESVAPRGAIRLEITETLAIDDTGAAVSALQRLRRAGFGLVMDDFGAGHSSPSRLAHLPFDAVKVDRTFLMGGSAAHSVLAGLLRLAADLGLDATTEGVESEEDLAFLAANGCVYAQGYHTGMPRDAAAVHRYLIEVTASADAVE